MGTINNGTQQLDYLQQVYKQNNKLSSGQPKPSSIDQPHIKQEHLKSQVMFDRLKQKIAT